MQALWPLSYEPNMIGRTHKRYATGPVSDDYTLHVIYTTDVVDLTGVEPVISAMRMRRSTN